MRVTIASNAKVAINLSEQKQILRFLEENSKMTYMLNKQENQRKLDETLLKDIVENYIDNHLKCIDFHTHLFPISFKGLCLTGIENILNYHYLHAEYLKLNLVSPRHFFNLADNLKAESIWNELFINRLPLSEATKGVVTILHALGIPLDLEYEELVNAFSTHCTAENYISKVYNLANISKVVVTNNIFDQNEVNFYGVLDESKFYSSIRLDSFFDNDVHQIVLNGKQYVLNGGGLNQYLDQVVAILKPLYFAISVDNEFSVKDDRYGFLKENIFDYSRKYKIPISLMLGVKRGVNQAYGLAGDGVIRCNIQFLAEIISLNPDIHFCVTVLSRENQYELAVLSRKFPNLTIFGNWWFLNNDIFINENTRMRLNLLGDNFIPQHSDARILEQLIYKWQHTNTLFKPILKEYFSFLLRNGYALSQNTVEAAIESFYNGRVNQIIKANKCITY